MNANAKKVRRLQASIRTMHRNVRLDRYQGRNGGGDTTYLQSQVDALFPSLSHKLQGLLTSEHKLAERISENQDLGNPRPELRARLVNLRHQIRELTNA